MRPEKFVFEMVSPVYLLTLDSDTTAAFPSGAAGQRSGGRSADRPKKGSGFRYAKLPECCL
jgi:hypothetical protein